MTITRSPHLLLPGGRRLTLELPVIVGILNVTPDSFSDGGQYFDESAAVAHALAMAAQGAGVIDVGGESTRPGAPAVSAPEQIRRTMGVIAKIKSQCAVVISIDTRSAEVAAAALAVGAEIINDVSGGSDAGMFALAARTGAAIILMHMRGTPATMQQQVDYQDVVAEVRQYLLARAAAAEAAGIDRRRIVVDPGIGFAKTAEQNLALLAHLDALVATGYPVMLGASRKAFLGLLAAKKGTVPFLPNKKAPSAFYAVASSLPKNEPDTFSGAAPGALPGAEERIWGTCATTALAVAAGVALLRVHEVLANRRAADVALAIRSARYES